MNIDKTIKELKVIFNNHMNERICVIGTTCCGKSTLVKELPYCVDMDDKIFSLLSDDEKEFVCQTPWTSKIGKEMNKLVKEKLKIIPGHPVFGTVIMHCDIVVYLDIDNNLLLERCNKRNVDFSDSLRMKENIKNDLKFFDGKVITYLL